jgi:galactokinase
VAWGLEQAGYRLRGANLYLAGDVPPGAGLSSSAAIEVATGYALLVNAGQAMDRTELAQICQRGESEFVGARVGIMDQFVSCHGQAGHALLLDCRSLAYRAVRLPEKMDLVICNTKVKHQLQASGYNDRRAECEEAVRLLAKVLPEGSLRDVNMQQLTEHRGELSETLYHRCRHVISENERVGKMAEALESGETGAWKELMAASHTSLRDDYQVSCRELDIMVEIAGRQSGIYGARMTGGGFGGCTINLVAKAHTPEFRERVSAEYQVATGLQPDVYVCEAAQGAEFIEIRD